MVSPTLLVWCLVALLVVSTLSSGIEEQFPELFDEDQNLGLTLPRIQQHARASSAAYCAGHNIQALANWQCGPCKATNWIVTDGHAVTNAAGVGYFTGYDKSNGRFLVIFRGSSNVPNWVSNLDFFRTRWAPCSGCEVHEGFLKAYLSTRADIVSHLTTLRNKYGAHPVAVMGHSLGAALATIALADLKRGVFAVTEVAGITHVTSDIIPEPLPFTADELAAVGGTQTTGIVFPIAPEFYTFGSPRVFNPAGSNWFRGIQPAESYRSSHGRDPVVRLPMIGMGFQHVSREVYFPQSGPTTAYKACSTATSEDGSCANSNVLSLNIEDHINYAGVAMVPSTTC